MKNFLLGVFVGILFSLLAGAGVLHRMGRLDQAVEKITTHFKPNPPMPVAPPQDDDPNPVKLGLGAIIGQPLMPADNPWNKDISQEPVDRLSDLILARIGLDKPLHPEFGTFYRGAPNGIPYVVVPGTQPKTRVVFDRYGDQSDQGDYPIPPDAAIEGGPNGNGDRHVIVLDRDNWKLYELFDARPQPEGKWLAASGAIFDLKSNALRKAGWTSADAAGLPILPGLVRYDECMLRKEINHALRFTVERTRKAYVHPATHFASSFADIDLPPMGCRLRLKSDYDITGFPEEAQVILRCLKKHGMILADNGGALFISGAPDPRWIDGNTHALKKVRGRDLEVVKMNDVYFEE